MGSKQSIFPSIFAPICPMYPFFYLLLASKSYFCPTQISVGSSVFIEERTLIDLRVMSRALRVLGFGLQAGIYAGLGDPDMV